MDGNSAVPNATATTYGNSRTHLPDAPANSASPGLLGVVSASPTPRALSRTHPPTRRLTPDNDSAGGSGRDPLTMTPSP
ncbi:hypothetical protein O1L60_11590 [Streptomyces diastatochromogenes]|nr:hypothetical protein [Streptomyces diastatochromogenes]